MSHESPEFPEEEQDSYQKFFAAFEIYRNPLGHAYSPNMAQNLWNSTQRELVERGCSDEELYGFLKRANEDLNAIALLRHQLRQL